MKTIFTLIVMLLAGTASATAQQEYRPLLKDGKVWHEISGPTWARDDAVYTLRGDTVIDGTTWMKLYVSTRRRGSGAAFSPERLDALLREEDGRVYERIGDYQILLYNFNFRKYSVVADNSDYETRVLAENNIEVDGGTFRRLTLRERSKPHGYDYIERGYWVEGVGSSRGLLSPGAWTVPGSGGDRPVACYEDGRCLFRYEDFLTGDVDQHHLAAGGEEASLGAAPLCTTAPFALMETVLAAGRDMQLEGGDLITAITLRGHNGGSELKRHVRVWFTHDNGKAPLDDFWPKGFYVLCYEGDCTIAAGGTADQPVDLVTIPFDDPQTVSNEKQNIRMLIESEGECSEQPVEFVQTSVQGSLVATAGADTVFTAAAHTANPAVTFTVARSVASGTTAVEQPRAGRPSAEAADATLYDLQGRRVEGQPRRGLYIQQGRKRVVR